MHSLFPPSAAVGRAGEERSFKKSKPSSSKRNFYFHDIFPQLHRIVKKEPAEATICNGVVLRLGSAVQVSGEEQEEKRNEERKSAEI
jgi:hypothetical protein